MIFKKKEENNNISPQTNKAEVRCRARVKSATQIRRRNLQFLAQPTPLGWTTHIHLLLSRYF